MSRMVVTAALLTMSLALASPASTRAAPTGAQTGPPAAAAPAITLNFEQADVETVIQAVSEFLGFNYVLAPDVRGPVTVRTAGVIPREHAFAVLLSILEPYGFTAVPSGQLYKFVRTETARERAIPTFITPPPPPETGATPGAAVAPEQPVTQVIVPRHAAATTLVGAVRPLVSSRGRVVAHPGANVLIVTDTAANVVSIQALVDHLDAETAAEAVEVIRLQYADAREVAHILTHVFATRMPWPPAIVADRHTNSLVIRARRTDLETIRRLLGHD